MHAPAAAAAQQHAEGLLHELRDERARVAAHHLQALAVQHGGAPGWLRGPPEAAVAARA